MRPVVWSEGARQDYFSILRYVSNDDPTTAEKIADAIEEAGNGLCRFSTGRPGRVAGTYEKSVFPYVLAYAIIPGATGEEISILRIIHTARNWPAGEWPE